MTWLNLVKYFLKIGHASNLSSLLFHSLKLSLSEARGVSCSAVFSSVNTCILSASPSFQCPSVPQTVSEMVAFFSHRALAGERCLEDCGHRTKILQVLMFILSLNWQYLLTGKHIASKLFVGECKYWFMWF